MKKYLGAGAAIMGTGLLAGTLVKKLTSPYAQAKRLLKQIKEEKNQRKRKKLLEKFYYLALQYNNSVHASRVDAEAL